MPHQSSSKRSLACRSALALALSVALPAAASSPEPWPRWERHDAAATASIEHSAWDQLLQTYVVASEDGIHRVRYGAWKQSGRPLLDRYLARLSATAISSYSRTEQLAFWINLYNALTVRVILDHYPVSSIREINLSQGWFTKGPWKTAVTRVEGVPLSLDDIEHRILRPIWRDPRLHYAVNCASISCPNLLRAAFRADNTETLLEEAARTYINHPRGLTWEGDGWVASKIYRWFGTDFGESEAERIAHLAAYANPERAAALRASPRIDAYRYDWSLNDVEGRPGEIPTP